MYAALAIALLLFVVDKLYDLTTALFRLIARTLRRLHQRRLRSKETRYGPGIPRK